MVDRKRSAGRRKDVPHLFADMTAALEDIHGIAVEGQVGDLSADIRWALLGDLRAGINRLRTICERISTALEAGRI